jgi:four helix bundle protein
MSAALCGVADYKNLHVWRKAHALSLSANQAATSIRGGHYAPLRSQIIRAAMSVPTNIVEGRAQSSDKQFARFLRYSAASASELEYHLITARDIGVMSPTVASSLLSQVDDVQRMLRALIYRLDTGTSRSSSETATSASAAPADPQSEEQQ